MSDGLIAGKYRMGYYFTQQNGGKTLLVLVVCLIIASMIIYKFHDEEYWVAKSFTFNGVQSFICIVLTVLLLWGFTWADEKLHPNSHGWLERVAWKSNYIPSLENLCDKEGNHCFSSYDEYREYYVNLVWSEIADGTREP